MASYIETKLKKKDNYYSIGLYRYRESDLLGEGYQSKVFKAIHIIKKYEVAIKIIDLQKITEGIQRQLVESQLRCLECLKSTPNVINLLEIIKTDSHWVVITELCKGDIRVKNFNTLPQIQLWHYIKQIIIGYKSLFKKGIIHRDLKPENLLLKREGQMKIGDFGFATTSLEAKEQNKYNIGSPHYMAPEVLIRNEYSHMSDIWSIGITFYQLAQGSVPWTSTDQNRIISEIHQGHMYRKIFQLKTSQKFKMFLIRALDPDPSSRMKPQQLFQYKLFGFSIPEQIPQDQNLEKKSDSTNETGKRFAIYEKLKKEYFNSNNKQESPFRDLNKKLNGNQKKAKNRRLSCDNNFQKMACNSKQKGQVKIQKQNGLSRASCDANRNKNSSFTKGSSNIKSPKTIFNRNQKLVVDIKIFDQLQRTMIGYLQMLRIIFTFLCSFKFQSLQKQNRVTQITNFRISLMDFILLTLFKLKNISMSGLLESIGTRNDILKFQDSKIGEKLLERIKQSEKQFLENKQLKKRVVNAKDQNIRQLIKQGELAKERLEKAEKAKTNYKFSQQIYQICLIVKILTYLEQHKNITKQEIDFISIKLSNKSSPKSK